MDQAENDPGGSSMDARFSPMTMNEEIVMRDSETNLEWVNGLTPEWHLLKLLRMAIYFDFLSCYISWFGEQRVGFITTF